MGKQRRSWSVEEKRALVLAVLSEHQSVAAVARQRGVNENQIYRWKEQFLAGGCQGLKGAKAQTADQRLVAENNQLKKLLGEKALELEILKNAIEPESCKTLPAAPRPWVTTSNPTLCAYPALVEFLRKPTRKLLAKNPLPSSVWIKMKRALQQHCKENPN